MKIENINVVGMEKEQIIDHVFKCHELIRKIKSIVNNVLYLNDSSDYASALWEILDEIGYSDEERNNLKYIDY